MGKHTASFRSDIEGLRAIAIVLVLLFHAGLAPRGGFVGVDVFFVISGYLITGLLSREAERSGQISLVQFYARRARRLLPAATLVLVTTTVFLQFFADTAERSIFAMDAVAASSYVANWRFMLRSVDYLAEDVQRSPFMHFWSLSVEEQFYFVWPLLIIGALRVARGEERQRTALNWALMVVFLPSFVWSIWYTSNATQEAFFATTTRLWELSIGALLALNETWLKRSNLIQSNVLGAVGCVLIVASALFFDEKTAWPGHLALAPTLGTAALIAAGSSQSGAFIQRMLGSKLMVWIGGLSYSIYLWHWPLLVVGQDWFDLKGPRWGLLLAGFSLVPAWLSYRFVERPLRFSPRMQASPWSTLSWGLNLSLISVIGALIVTTQDEDSHIRSTSGLPLLTVQRDRVTATPPNWGAGSLKNAPHKAKAGIPKKRYAYYEPSPALARKDFPASYDLGCQTGRSGTRPTWCEAGAAKGARTAVMVGDSKILQYYDALDVVGQAFNIKIRTATKATCPFAYVYAYDECSEFRDNVLAALREDPPTS